MVKTPLSVPPKKQDGYFCKLLKWLHLHKAPLCVSCISQSWCVFRRHLSGESFGVLVLALPHSPIHPSTLSVLFIKCLVRAGLSPRCLRYSSEYDTQYSCSLYRVYIPAWGVVMETNDDKNYMLKFITSLTHFWKNDLRLISFPSLVLAYLCICLFIVIIHKSTRFQKGLDFMKP